jgi:hypothetical protein
MPQPSLEKWQDIRYGFENSANFPNCIGALDGKHVRIIKRIKSGSRFFNYKHYFSIVLLAICDANYYFTFIDVVLMGKTVIPMSSKRVFFGKKIEKNELGIPQARPLPDTNERFLPHIIVADEAFGISQHVLRPYARKNLNYKKKIFNYRLTRARRFIECTFGILSNKWIIFHRPMNVDVKLAVSIVKTCCLLHNFVRVRDGYNFEQTLTVVGLENFEVTGAVTRSCNSTRDSFANYFISTGKVPWQDSKIH